MKQRRIKINELNISESEKEIYWIFLKKDKRINKDKVDKLEKKETKN